jgi:multiple sugar transport system permease protein/raffinose/stachyose/melibiose transport system permease protein
MPIRTRPSPLARGERRVGLLFVLPALALFALFVGWPILHSVYLSTTTWAGFGVPTFTGPANYVRMAGDPVFRTALLITVGFTAVTTVLQTVLPMLVAILVHAGWRRAGVVIRTVLFLPAVISLVVTGVLWQLIYDPNLGTLNQLLADIGLESWRQQWLGDPNLVVPSLIVVSLWQSLGLYMLIFFAGLQGIDPTLYEAATVDGANARQRLWHVTVPQLRTVTGVVVALNLINGFKTFDLVYVMTGGGPNHASEVLGTYLYSLAFGSISGSVPQIGYATAISIVVMLLCLAAAVVQFAVNRKAADVH